MKSIRDHYALKFIDRETARTSDDDNDKHKSNQE